MSAVTSERSEGLVPSNNNVNNVEKHLVVARLASGKSVFVEIRIPECKHVPASMVRDALRACLQTMEGRE